MANLPNRTYGQMTRPVVTGSHTYVVYALMWWNGNEMHFVSVKIDMYLMITWSLRPHDYDMKMKFINDVFHKNFEKGYDYWPMELYA